MPDPIIFSFFTKIYILFYLIIFRVKCWESFDRTSFLRVGRFLLLSSETFHLLNGILPLCATKFIACTVSQSNQWDTPMLTGAKSTHMPPAVISCVSWFVFHFLTLLRDEKQKTFACRRVSQVVVTWFCTSSRQLSQAPTARDDCRFPCVYCTIGSKLAVSVVAFVIFVTVQSSWTFNSV